MNRENENLNPQIRDVDIGIKNLRKIKIYPMSMHDEAKFIKLVEEILNSYFTQLGEGEESLSKENLMPLIIAIKNVIGNNIQELIAIVTDVEEIDPKEFFKNTTNTQMSEIVNHIVRDNFEEPSKNFLSLANDFKSLFQFTRQLPESLSDTDNMISPTSIEELLEKEG